MPPGRNGNQQVTTAMTTTTSSIIGQSIPDKNLSRLSLVGHTKADMEAWVASLPIMNVGETAKRLYQTLQELTRLRDFRRKPL
jgi:hypothetical protein